jgi:hypothetical protein
MARSLALRLAKNGGHTASRWEGGTLICQYGKGVVLPIIEKLWRRSSEVSDGDRGGTHNCI